MSRYLKTACWEGLSAVIFSIFFILTVGYFNDNVNLQLISKYLAVAVSVFWFILVSFFTIMLLLSLEGVKRNIKAYFQEPNHWQLKLVEKNKRILRRAVENAEQLVGLYNDYEWVQDLLAKYQNYYVYEKTQHYIKAYLAKPDKKLAKRETRREIDDFISALDEVYKTVDKIEACRLAFTKVYDQQIDDLDKINRVDVIDLSLWFKNLFDYELILANDLFKEVLPKDNNLPSKYSIDWLTYKNEASEKLADILENLKWLIDDYDGVLAWQKNKEEAWFSLEIKDVFAGWPSYKACFNHKAEAMATEMTLFENQHPVYEETELAEDFFDELKSLINEQEDNFFLITNFPKDFDKKEKDILTAWHTLEANFKKVISQNGENFKFTVNMLAANSAIACLRKEFSLEPINWQRMEYFLAGAEQLLPIDDIDQVKI